MRSTVALLLLLVAAGRCAAAANFSQLVAATRAECDGDLCVGHVPCSEVSELSSRLQGAAVFRSNPATGRTSADLEKAAADSAEAKDPVTVPTSANTELSSPLPPATTSTSASEEVSSTDASRQRRAAEETCFLVYHPDYRDHGGKRINETEPPPQRNTSLEVWLFGFLSVGFISLSGLFGVIFVPLMKKRIFDVVMRYLVGLGIGALSATSIFQLIPECFQIMDRDYLPASVVIWMTVWVFFVFESLCKILLNNNEGHHGHSHATRKSSSGDRSSARPIYKPKNENLDSIEVDCFLPKSFDNGNAVAETKSIDNQLAASTKLNKDTKMAFHHRSHDYLAEAAKEKSSKKGLSSISSVAWMIILGDGIHNFIDGVSIGAGFTQSNLTGLSISLAIVFEEFPHELGDFAILISSGMSVRKALAFNFASACTAFLGLVLGIVLESFEINSYIFGLAGGLFLYISLSDLIPQLNIMLDKALEDEEHGRRNSFFILIQQNLGILTGMILIYIISKYSDLITLN